VSYTVRTTVITEIWFSFVIFLPWHYGVCTRNNTNIRRKNLKYVSLLFSSIRLKYIAITSPKQ